MNREFFKARRFRVGLSILIAAAALFLALAKSRGGDSFETAFSRALTRLGESKTVTDGKLHYAPTPAQFVVSRAQAAGIVEGDILGRLGAKS